MKFTNSLLAGIIAAAFSAQSVNAVDWGRMCSDANFGGTCTTYQSGQVGQCVNFTGKDGFWNDKVSSLTVVDKAMCHFFAADQCSGDADIFRAGAHPVVGLNDQYTSFRCVFI